MSGSAYGFPCLGGPWTPAATLRFPIQGDRVSAAEQVYREELVREGAKSSEAERVAPGAARALSGVALWPRLVLDPAGKYVCESRGPRGESQKSHWQTVLPLLAPRPVQVASTSVVELDATVTLGAAVDEPAKYDLRARVV